jgi:hypothetical protein
MKLASYDTYVHSTRNKHTNKQTGNTILDNAESPDRLAYGSLSNDIPIRHTEQLESGRLLAAETSRAAACTLHHT